MVRRDRKMVKPLNLLLVGIAIILVFLIYSCLPFERVSKVNTDSYDNLTTNSCFVKGTIVDICDEGIIQHGHCWSINPNPIVSKDKTELGTRDITGEYVSNLMNLAPGKKYYVKAYVIDKEGEHYGREINFTTLSLPVPAAPSNLNAEPVSKFQINLSWSDNSDNESGFQLERSSDGVNWSEIATVGAGINTFQNVGLSAASKYYYRVRAFNPGGNSDYSNTVNATTFSDIPVPAAPTYPGADAESSSQITINWMDNADNEEGYIIERSGDGTNWEIIDTVGAGAATGVMNYRDTGLLPSTDYYYRVRAYNAGGNSDPSSTVNATTFSDDEIPVAPTDLAAEAISSSQINLYWQDNSNNEEGFKILRSLDGINWDTIDIVGMDATVYSNTGLENFGPYFYRVISFNGAGNSIPSNPIEVIACIEPTVTTLGMVNPGTTFATLVGNVISPTYPAIITFEYGTSLDYEYSITLDEFPVITDMETPAEISHVVTDLLPNTPYNFRIKAVNCGGEDVGDNFVFITDPNEVYDANDNVYGVIRIGSQLWMRENLKATLTMDGSGPVPLITDGTEWSNLTSPGYCWYNNDERYKDVYGALYNWYAVNEEELCPINMHIATEGDWRILTNYLGGESFAGGMMKEEGFDHWEVPNLDANNINGFTALPGGHRTNFGEFSEVRLGGYWWTSSENSEFDAWMRAAKYDTGELFRFNNSKTYGYSVRCVR